MKTYQIKNITNFKYKTIDDRKEWIGLFIVIKTLTEGERAELPEVILMDNEYEFKSPYREINTSAVQHIQQIDSGILFATYSGTLYELTEIKT